MLASCLIDLIWSVFDKVVAEINGAYISWTTFYRRTHVAYNKWEVMLNQIVQKEMMNGC